MIMLKEIRFIRSLNRCFSLMTLITFSGILSSCVTQSEVEYLQDTDKRIKSFSAADVQDYRLKPDDELYIQVNSLDEAAANVFSSSSNQQSSVSKDISPYGASLLSYTIDKNGYVILPFIGYIFVEDKTISQVAEILKDSLNSILNQPIVTVKLVNRYISVLGEVRNPGRYLYAQERITVYDALGLAGDITEYGNRSEVILARNEGGKNLRININLTKSDIFTSNYYYLRPNDIVYVKPLRKKFWGMREFPFQIILSSLTVVLLFYSVLK